MRIHLTSVSIDHYDRALDFYTKKLGFVKKHDIELGPGARWITVVSPEDPDGTDESSTTNLVKYVPAGTSKHVTQEAVEGTPATEDSWTNLQWHTWTGKKWESDADPPLDADGWHATQGDPQSENHSIPPRVPNDPYFVSNGNSGNGDWFLWTGTFVPGSPGTEGHDEVSHTDYKWQKQTRTFTEGVDCPDPGPDCEANPQAEGCPPVDEGRKVVVCKYVGTPPGTPDHIIVVSVNSLPGFDPETSTFPFPFGDAQDSIAIR